MQRRTISKLALGIALALALPRSGQAQFQQNPKFRTGYVLLQGGRGVSSAVELAANVVPERLRRRQQADAQAPPAPINLTVQLTGHIGQLPGDDNFGIYRLDLLWSPESEISPVQMDAAWEAARAELETTTRSIQKLARDERRKQTDRALQELAEHRAKLQAEVEAAAALLGEKYAGGSRQHFEEAYAQTRQRQREIALSRISVEARREAIERRIDELRATASESKEDDPLIKEYRKIVDIREKQLEASRALHDENTISANELQQAEAEMAKARVELIKAVRSAEEQSAGPILRELNNELSRLVVQSAEVEAQLKMVEGMIGELGEQVAASRRAEAETHGIQQRLNAARQRLGQVEESFSNVEQNAASQPDAELTLHPLDKELPVPPPAGEAKQLAPGQ